MWTWAEYKTFDRIPPLPSALRLSSTRSPHLCFQTPYWSRTSIASVGMHKYPPPTHTHPNFFVYFATFLPFSKMPPSPTPPFFFSSSLLTHQLSVWPRAWCFCGDISSSDASFMLWMVLEAGFTAPAVMPRRLSLSHLAVKWSAGPPWARRLPGHYR